MRLAYLDRMSVSRILVSSGSDFESTVGYSRAVRVGPHVSVAGTTGPGPPDDIGAQTREALRRIEIALNRRELCSATWSAPASM
jgi:enamine deaminase RidA (YjgF/YER057c/UK114 family)